MYCIRRGTGVKWFGSYEVEKVLQYRTSVHRIVAGNVGVRFQGQTDGHKIDF